MRHISKVAAAFIFAGAPAAMFCASGLAVPDLTVGRNLQMDASVKLPEAAPRAGLSLTVTSDDPTRLLLSKAPDQAGSASITLTVNSGFVYSPEFSVQGLADNGTVTYNVNVDGVGTAKGKVTLVPSAIVIMGPFKAPSFRTTPRGRPSKLVLISATLDSSMKVSQEQMVAGGTRVTVRIENSHTECGTLNESAVTLMGGEAETTTYFKPAAEGNATLTPVPPLGFRASADYASVVATVEKPGIAVAEGLIIGKDLQVPAGIALGEPAGPEGVKVTLTSSDASKLLLSTAEDKLGSGTITLTVPPGQFTANYCLQALSDTGLVTHQATAPGFRTRIGHTQLAPSGVIVGYSNYGPPDEGAVKQRIGGHEERSFYTSLADSKKNPIHVMVWSAYLDSGLAADFTVQELRPGVSATVMLKSSDPAVGTVESPVTIHSGSNRAASRFTPMKPGKTVISIDTPSGFATPKNAVYVPAFVRD
jgi:hypothetical protein